MKRLGLLTLAMLGASLPAPPALADDDDDEHYYPYSCYACGDADEIGDCDPGLRFLHLGSSDADWWIHPNAPRMYENFAGRQYVSSTYGYAAAVPVAPVVTRTWQYGWGVPSSRVDFFTWTYRPATGNTTRYVEYPGGIVVPVATDTAYLGYHYGRVPY